MKRPLTSYSVPDVAAVVFAVVVGAVLVYAASTTGGALAPFNPSWEGTSELRTVADDAGAETTVLEDVEEYDELDAEGTLVLVIGVGDYDTDERERIRAFVERGGTVLIADASGENADPLLESIGASTRIDGDPLRDERHYYRSPSLPVATETADHPYTNDSESLTLNHGTALEPGEATVVVRSSRFAYLDRNRNDALDSDDELGSYPVATVEGIGTGEVIVVSDSSAFTNVMMERPENRAFVASVFGAHDQVVLDVSQRGDTPILITALMALRESSALQLLFGGGLIAGLALLARRPGIVDRLSGATSERFDPLAEAERSPRELRERLADDHPEWSEVKRERVVVRIVRNRR